MNTATTTTGTIDGPSIDELVRFFQSAYQPARTDSKDSSMVDPIVTRRDRIHAHTKGIEKQVETILGGSKTASKSAAGSIIHKLAYAAAQADGYHGGTDSFTQEQVRKYLSQASAATGDPTLGNMTELTKSIMAMISAKPGTPEYNADSALGHLISYVASQNDTETKRMNHYRTVVSEKWTEPGTALTLQKALGGALGIPLHSTATAGNFFQELETRAAAESQLRTIKQAPKPYLQGSAYSAPSYSGAAATSGHH